MRNAGKMGNHRQALQLIVSDLQDVAYAIEFCKEHNYKSLWDELVTYSLEKPSMCTQAKIPACKVYYNI